MLKKLRFSAPGKIIISGQHSVVYEKNALCGAIDLKCKCEMQTQNNSDAIITFHLHDFKQKIIVKLNEIQDKESVNLLSYHEYIKQHNLQNTKQQIFKYKVLICIWKLKHLKSKEVKLFLSFPCNYILSISSQIPISGGLGSSAAISTCIAAALISVIQSFDKTYNPLQFDKQLIRSIAYQYEKIYHTKPSGIDNYVSLNGGLIVYKRSSNNSTPCQPYSLDWNLNLKLGVIDSKIQKNTSKAVMKVAQQYSTYGKKIIQQIGQLTDSMINALQCQNQNKFLQLTRQNHVLLSQLGLSNQIIQKIVKEYSSQQTSAKITGAGMGGYILVIGKNHVIMQGVQWKSISKKGLQIEYI